MTSRLVLAFVLLALAAAPAAAAPVYTPSTTVAGPADGVSADQVLAAGDGSAVLLTTTVTGPVSSVVEARIRRPGQPLGAPITIRQNATGATAAIDASGLVTIAWIRFEVDLSIPKADGWVETRTLALDGTLGPVEELDAETDLAPFTEPSVDVAVAPAGHAVIAWQLEGKGHVLARKVGQAFPATAVDLPPAQAQWLTAAVAGDGQAYAAYVDSATSWPYVARIPAAAGLPQVVNLGAVDVHSQMPSIAVAPDGAHVYAAWHDSFEGQKQVDAATLTTAPFAKEGPTKTLSPAGLDPSSITVAAVPDAVITTFEDYAERVYANVRGAGPFSATDTVDLGPGDGPFLAVAGEQAALAYRDKATDPLQVSVRVRESGGWSAAVPVSPAGQPDADFPVQPRVAVDGAGGVTAAWSRNVADKHVVEIAYGDNDGPPRVDPVAFPASATAGVPAAFSATPSDWLPVRVDWSFGASGPAVTHAFAAPGAQPVTMTATDAAGRATTRSATVAVATARTPEPVATIGAFSRKRIRGSASAAAGVAKVEVALARKRGKRCGQLKSRKPRFGAYKRGPCTPKRFLAAKGTTAWKLTFKHKLPRGRYRIAVRVTDTAGTVTKITAHKRLR
jgi:hypothetical protein